jgi:hypothetical protein
MARAEEPEYYPKTGVSEPWQKRDMVQSEVTPTIVAGVCDPGVPITTGLREAGNAGPIAARAEERECYPKAAVFEPWQKRELAFDISRFPV